MTTRKWIVFDVVLAVIATVLVITFFATNPIATANPDAKFVELPASGVIFTSKMPEGTRVFISDESVDNTTAFAMYIFRPDGVGVVVLISDSNLDGIPDEAIAMLGDIDLTESSGISVKNVIPIDVIKPNNKKAATRDFTFFAEAMKKVSKITRNEMFSIVSKIEPGKTVTS